LRIDGFGDTIFSGTKTVVMKETKYHSRSYTRMSKSAGSTFALCDPAGEPTFLSVSFKTAAVWKQSGFSLLFVHMLRMWTPPVAFIPCGEDPDGGIFEEHGGVMNEFSPTLTKPPNCPKNQDHV